jgi:hypothetical protein
MLILFFALNVWASTKIETTLLDKLHEAKPIPYGFAANSPVPALAHGAKAEPAAVSRFWELHPEYEHRLGRTLYWHDARNLFWADHTAVTPDAVLIKTDSDLYHYDGPVMQSALEVKCPYDAGKFREWRLSGWPAIEKEHKAQVHWTMIVPHFDYVHFASFDPRAPEGENYFDLEVPADHDYINQLVEKARAFLKVFRAGGRFAAPPKKEKVPATTKSVRGLL